MENKLEYKNMMNLLEEGQIHEVSFHITDYAHYKSCKLFRNVDVLHNGNELIMICIDPVPDKSESVCFYKKYDHTYKVFNLGKNKKYSLKQIWDRVGIKEIN